MVAHHMLRRETESQIDGSQITMVYMLRMNQAISISMTILFGLSGCIALCALFQFRVVLHLWHRDTATLLGVMLLISDGKSTFSMPDLLSSRTESDKAQWSNGGFTPFVLRPWLRGVIVIYAIGLISTLIIFLQISKTPYGVGSVDEDSYSSLIWKSLSTLALLLIAIFTTSSDVAVRDLMALVQLSGKDSCYAWQLDFSLLDMLGLRSLKISIGLRAPAVTLTQTLTILCSFLATLSSVLFTPQLSHELTDTHFQQSNSFGDGLG